MGGYGVGVEKSISSVYLLSMAIRICRGDIPSAFIVITSRVTPKQISQVGAMSSKTTLPSGFTRLT